MPLSVGCARIVLGPSDAVTGTQFHQLDRLGIDEHTVAPLDPGSTIVVPECDPAVLTCWNRTVRGDARRDPGSLGLGGELRL